MKITEKEFNIETGEEIFTERDETAAEIAEREAFEARIAFLAEQEATKVAEKAALLAKLGITEDEAKLLLG